MIVIVQSGSMHVPVSEEGDDLLDLYEDGVMTDEEVELIPTCRAVPQCVCVQWAILEQVNQKYMVAFWWAQNLVTKVGCLSLCAVGYSVSAVAIIQAIHMRAQWL